jgi:hypothetical protein
MVAAIETQSSRTLDTGRFHFRMGIVFVLIAFSGFVPTYWAPVVAGTFAAPPIVHVHGALLTSNGSLTSSPPRIPKRRVNRF